MSGSTAALTSKIPPGRRPLRAGGRNSKFPIESLCPLPCALSPAPFTFSPLPFTLYPLPLALSFFPCPFIQSPAWFSTSPDKIANKSPMPAEKEKKQTSPRQSIALCRIPRYRYTSAKSCRRWRAHPCST